MQAEWLDVIPWILGAAAVGLSFLVFPSVGAQSPMEPLPVPRDSNVVDLAEFRARRTRTAQRTSV